MPEAPLGILFVRNPFTHDARVLRAAKVMSEAGLRPEVVAVMATTTRTRDEIVDGVPVHRLDPGSPLSGLRRLRRRAKTPSAFVDRSAAATRVPTSIVRLHRWFRTMDFYRRGIGVVLRRRPRLVHCNDYNTMWIGLAARVLTGARVIYDSHELWPDRNGRPEPRWWLLACEAMFVRVAHQVITASPGFADVMHRRYRIRRPEVVLNVPPRGRLAADSTNERPSTVVYVGAIARNRGLEQAIDAIAAVPGARLELLGPGDLAYRDELATRARRSGVGARVVMLSVVDPKDVVASIRGAAAGLSLFQATCLSHELVAPNKLFEYMAAGLPVLVSDLPVMRGFLSEWGFGLAAPPDEPAAIASQLRELLEPARNRQFRAAAERAADIVTWEREANKLRQTYSWHEAP